MLRSQKLIALIAFSVLLNVTAFGQNGEAKRFQAASEYSKKSMGVALLIIKGEETLVEEYSVSAGIPIPWFIASGTKSFSGVMLAAAVDDGLISSFEEKVSETIVEWKQDDKRKDVTLRQLLNLTSGIDPGNAVLVSEFKASVSTAASDLPGSRFKYGPNPFQIFGEVMTRKLKGSKESVQGYLERRILKPTGINIAVWRKVGNDPILANGMALTARDWAKFGVLLRDKGIFKGKRIISENRINELLVGSEANPAYGVTFWLNRSGMKARGGLFEMFESDADESLGKDIFMAAGLGNQRLYIIPSENIVVVRFGAFGSFSDKEFLRLLLRKEEAK